jgi:ribokinase
MVDADDSTVIVNAGANAALQPERVAGATDMLQHAAAVLIQFETPLAAAVAAAAAAPGLVVVNPSPAMTLPTGLSEAVDVLVPNRLELAALAEAEPAPDFHTIVAQARAVARSRVVVTLGAEGAIVIDEADAFHVPAEKVDVVDATAAGDSFCAALVDGLIDGSPLVEAAQWATAVAARVVARHGAMDSIPSAASLRRLRQTFASRPFEPISRKQV